MTIVAAMPSLSGCFGPLAKRLADKETYPIIAEKQEAVFGEARAFTIEEIPDPLTERVIEKAGEASYEYTDTGLEVSLSQMLALAVQNSRPYQTEKERLFLTALTLTEARHDFSPIFSGFIAARVNRTGPPVGLDDPTRFNEVDTNLAVTKLFASGARASVSIANSFTRFLGTSDPDRSSQTGELAFSIVQPLLRGAGPDVVLENLRQSERDVVYAVRDFARFEKNFVVDRIEEYFRLLQQRDVVENEAESFESLRLGRERSEALAEAGRLDIFQVEQARQEELIASNRLINAQTDYVQELDRFKINLGLPTEIDLIPDPTELQTLIDRGLAPIDLSVEEAIEVALRDRLDLKTVRGEVYDAERLLYVAENNLLADLDVSASLTIPDEGQNQPFSFDTRRRDYEIRLDAELPLDRKLERNNYRRAVIQLEAARRDAEELRDRIVQDVRSTYQDLQNARRSYEIQQASVRVGERRVDSSKLLLQAGRKTVRDVLESEVDLRDARNSLTRALVDYTIARLRFLVAIEQLVVEEKGVYSATSVVEDSEAIQPEEFENNGNS